MLALLGAASVLSLAGSVPRRAARPASLRFAASHRCGWPVATEAAGELRLADDVGDGSGPGGDVYEVVLARPVGMQLMERPGGGVAVSMVYQAGNAANEGVRVGDVVLATSASIGPQMWEKSTVAGVESAIRTRIDGNIRLRLRRGTQRPPTWDAPLQWTYDVELGRPLGLVLRDRARSGQAAAIEVAEVVAGSSAAADGRVRAGDLLLATSASFGEQMWQKSSLEGVTSAISTRLALNPTVRSPVITLSVLRPLRVLPPLASRAAPQACAATLSGYHPMLPDAGAAAAAANRAARAVGEGDLRDRAGRAQDPLGGGAPLAAQPAARDAPRCGQVTRGARVAAAERRSRAGTPGAALRLKPEPFA